jgi:hypothetical protein
MVFPKGAAKRCAGFPTSYGCGLGVIPLKGRRGNGSDPGEAQGLRIGIKFMKFNEAQTPDLVTYICENENR